MKRAPILWYRIVLPFGILGGVACAGDPPAGPLDRDLPGDSLPPAPTVSAIRITDASIAVLEDSMHRLSVVAADRNGSRVNVTPVWTSSDSSVAQVAPNGWVTARSPGTATISARVESKIATARVDVMPRVVRVVVSDSLTLKLDRTANLTAAGFDKRGDPVGGVEPAWSVDREDVVSVDDSGFVAALSVGRASVSAMMHGTVGSVNVVTERPTLTAVSAGKVHACAITEDAVMYCWGGGAHGELGDGAATARPTPRRVAGGHRFEYVSAGAGYTCGVTLESRAYCWGDNRMMELGTMDPTPGGIGAVPMRVEYDSDVSTISTSDMAHTCVMGPEAWCWGYNRFGQVGNGSTADERVAVPVVGGVQLVNIEARFIRTCGIAVGGDLYCWGRGGNAVQGRSANDLSICSGRECYMYPRKVESSRVFSSVSPGMLHTCAIAQTGRVFCWGMNDYGQLGTGTTDSLINPAEVVGGITYSSVTASRLSTCALTLAGETHCWGSDEFGQLGNDVAFADTNVPVPAAGSRTYTSLSTGFFHACAISSSGDAYCWGRNHKGQLGDGTKTNSGVPVEVRWRL